ncbi:ABC transporter ATP-binding protein [Paenibacillus sp. OAS669]|uniref:ABC transporter ATP-binding protein n=1 Tax=Paenibacillus sp. OAS669 TaxID=2663821 RepID=UPI00178A05F8|nr:ABC transporter ATP-binding protein [Paenibacillus sp. OAS669]MBE1442820.1 peptide/nickel transport system ATP-binding protein [Paenibacillus sp. OAS669]
MAPLLQIQNVTASFRTKEGMVHAVKGVSLDLHQGQIWGLIGETGSGKSVMGLSIPGLLPDTAQVTGSIMFKGQDVLKLEPKSLRKWRGSEIALIPQNPATSLNPVLTIGYQLKESMVRYRTDKRRKQLHTDAVQLLSRLQMPEPERKMGSYPFQLSGGMKQRVLAAIGMCGHPSLIIADEPTKGLDAMVRYQTVEVMRTVAQQTGAGMLVITHDLHVAESLCDRIGVMYAGQIVEQGDAKELFRNPKHPYTQGLLGSIPGRGMVPIPGTSMGVSETSTGCSFYSRCKHRQQECSMEMPELYSLSTVTTPGSCTGTEQAEASKARCFLYDPSRQPEQNLSNRLAT